MFRQALDVVRELVTGYHPRKETKQPTAALLFSTPTTIGERLSSEQKEPKPELASIDPVKESKQSATPSTTTVVLNQLSDNGTVLDGLIPEPLLKLIAGYADVNVPEGYETPLLCTSPLLLSKLIEVYTRALAHELLWHLRIHEPHALTEILDSLKQNPVCLTTVVQIKDPYGQRVQNTILNIMRSAGDRDPFKMKAGTHYGLVELLKPCFESMKDEYKEYKRQIAEWDAKAVAATELTMAPYEKAYQTLCDQIVQDTKEIPAVADDKTFETLLDLPMAQEFRKALRPNPQNLVEWGELFSFGILLKFFEYWAKKEQEGALGPWNSVKNCLFGAIVYFALQARVQRIDLEVFKTGLGNVNINKGKVPIRIDWTNAVPGAVCGLTAQKLKDLGLRWFFGLFGNKCAGIGSPPGPLGPASAAIKISIKQKQHRLD